MPARSSSPDPRDDLPEALALAREAARRAGRIQLERYEQLERIVHKSKRDVVTEVDTLCEETIIAAIRSAYPDDAILAEESGAHRSHLGKGVDPAARTGRTWVIDPLDGTVNYANGIPIFCVSIALAIEGRPVLGIVHDAVRDELFEATAGGGARLDGLPIRLPEKENLSDYVVSLTLPSRGSSRRERRIRAAIRVSRVLGSAALALAYVANGRFDAFIQLRGLSSWDIAAAGLIAEEGGAAVTDGRGGPWFDIAATTRRTAVVAAPPRHHATLLELLR